MSHTVTKRLIIVATILFLVSNCLAQSASYKLRYTSSLRWLSFKEQTATKDKGMIVVGIAGQIDDSSDLMITKFDEYGSTVWSKVFPSSGRLQNMTVIEMSDGNIAVISDLAFATAVGYNSYVFVMKLNCRGEPLWTKRYALPVAVGYKLVQPAGLKEGKNGDLIVSFHSTQRGDLMSAIMRINNTGSMVWSKTFTGTNAECYYIPEAFYKNNKIYVLGQEHYVGNFITPVKRLFSMVLNYDNGAIEKQQGYILAEIIAGQTVLYSHPKIHFDAEQLLDNTFALFGIFSDGTQQTFYYYKLIINEDLSIKQSQAYSTSTRIALQRSKITVFPNGQTHITGPNYESFTHYWYGADKSNNTIFQRKTNYAGSILFNGDQAFPLEGDRYGYLLSHITSNRYEVDIAMVRDNTSNMTPCLGVDTSFVTQVPWQSSLTNWSWATVEDNKVAITDYSLAGVNLNMFSSELCATPKPKLLSITGDATICTGTSTPFLYQARTLKKEFKPVQWSMSPGSYEEFKTLNDSTISIVFKNAVSGPYQVKLYAKGGDCLTAEDSLEIQVYPAPNLPHSITICTQPVQVNAGNWFKSYRWPDGSTGPTFTITQPGTYEVELVTQCNEVVRHTINAYSGKIGLQNNISLCKYDTIELKAPAGFVDYSWGPDYNIIHLSDEVVKVYPEKDTIYVLSSETADGCQLKDTVKLKLKSSPSIHIGNDTTICIEGDLILKASTGFPDYLWSTGATTNSIKVTKPGEYIVRVTAPNGCVAYDTIHLTAKNCPRRMKLPNAFSPNNDGANDLFKPSVQGTLEYFELTVYNRWGGIIFKTTSPATGWNGAVGGVQQNSGTYIWTCRYKFRGEAAQAEKGNLLLIR